MQAEKKDSDEKMECIIFRILEAENPSEEFMNKVVFLHMIDNSVCVQIELWRFQEARANNQNWEISEDLQEYLDELKENETPREDLIDNTENRIEYHEILTDFIKSSKIMIASIEENVLLREFVGTDVMDAGLQIMRKDLERMKSHLLWLES